MARPSSVRVGMWVPYTGKGSGNSGVLAQANLMVLQITRLWSAMDQAESQDGARALRVFVAPEWSFRNTDGAPIGEEEMNAVFERVRTATADLEMLVIPGSVYWGRPVRHPKYRYAAFNCAEAMWKGTSLLRHYKKMYGDLCAADEYWGMYRPDANRSKDVNDEALPEILDPSAVDAYLRPGYFRVPEVGVSAGIDICRDGSASVLQAAYVKRYPAQKGIDLHFNVSASGGTMVNSSAARVCVAKAPDTTGGYTVGCDGNQPVDAKAHFGARIAASRRSYPPGDAVPTVAQVASGEVSVSPEWSTRKSVLPNEPRLVLFEPLPLRTDLGEYPGLPADTVAIPGTLKLLDRSPQPV